MINFLKKLKGSLTLHEGTGMMLISFSISIDRLGGASLGQAIITGMLFGFCWFYFVNEK